MGINKRIVLPLTAWRRLVAVTVVTLSYAGGMASAHAAASTGAAAVPSAGAAPADGTAPNGAQQNRDNWGRYIALMTQNLYEGLIMAQGQTTCASDPSYNCTGIMMSAFENQPDPAYWMSTNPDNNKLSLSHLLKSTSQGKGSGWVIFGGTGYMLWPSTTLKGEMTRRNLTNNAFPTIYRCAFPQDAYTSDRLDSGCGAFPKSTPADKDGPCQAQGINTASDWLNAFGKKDLFMQQCGFTLQVSPAADKQTMTTVRQIQETLINQGTTNFFGSYNEIIMKPWSSYQPGLIPLLGFFYVEPDSTKFLVTRDPKKVRLTPGGNLTTVQAQQRDYYNKTAIFAPIVQISGKSWSEAVFEYKHEQQVDTIPSQVKVLPQ